MTTALLTSLLAFFHSAPEPLPAWAQTQWANAAIGKTFNRGTYAKPELLRADFNGDGKPDVAVLIVRKATGSREILILHQGLKEHFVLGTGLESSGSVIKGDFSWVDQWSLYTKPTTYENLFGSSGDLAGSRKVKLLRPAIGIAAEEQGGGMIYWNGKRYIWLHQTC